MSGKLNGAVYKSGPRTKARRTLLRLACNADHWGFAQIRVDTIARDIQVNERTVLRDLQELAASGWLQAVQKAVDGCGNVYFLNRAKLGVHEDPKGPKSPLHREFLDRAGAQWRGPRFAQEMVEKPLSTGDNPQPPQVTKTARQVTPGAETGDKRAFPNRKLRGYSVLSVDPPSVEGATTAGEDFFSVVRDRGGGLRRIA